MDWYGVLLGLGVLLLVLLLNALRRKPQPAAAEKFWVGDLSMESLAYYCGYDFMKPILVSVRGVLYDASNRGDLYGPGKELHVYAGKEIARALALGSTKPGDVGSSEIDDLPAHAHARLEARLAEMVGLMKMEVVGQVVPLKEMTLEELARHDGSLPAEFPLRLAIQGIVYDITKGSDFYGPDGCYPFAGRECARAFALLSTETSDCVDDLEGLSPMELQNLSDWKGKFNSKYPIVGRIVPSGTQKAKAA
uniref:Cytochrome b5 heme-binding domain-containing protein n=1 Tax=Chlamydomonas euryale TaxID=1486919 RepID=A0A7R9V3T3_9CHLO|mmetsp:Transcript_17129/g.51400  ORF Transcript_17129/g.51400 Transcript_17129/m.51400 type:complete len:250 (+) Transcript_17129:529-1278(+)